MLTLQLLNGLTVGAVYGLVGLGFALIYGVLDLVTFAHGDVYMFGAFVAFSAIILLNMGFFPALFLTLLITGIIGFMIERVAYKPIRKEPVIMQLISSLMIAIILRNVAMLIWGSRTVPFPNIIGDKIEILIPAIVFVIVLLIHIVLTRTKFGITVRATSMDLEMTAALGVNIENIIAIIFIVGSALGGLAGIMVGMYYESISFEMGISMGIKAFIAAIIGGLGSIYGPIIGGLVLGVAESLAAAYISTDYKDALAYVILIFMLFVRPSGLLGFKVEKGG